MSYFNIPRAETRDAYWWLTSDTQEAANWRKEAEMPAYNRVFDQAQRERQGTTFNIPATVTERPATHLPHYFDVPRRANQGKTGKIFDIPTEGT